MDSMTFCNSITLSKCMQIKQKRRTKSVIVQYHQTNPFTVKIEKEKREK